MANLFMILLLLSLAALVVGLIKPSMVVRWGKRRGRGRSSLIYGVTAIVFFVAFGVTAPNTPSTSPSAPAAKNNTSPTKVSNPSVSTANAVPPTNGTSSVNSTASTKTTTTTSTSGSTANSTKTSGSASTSTTFRTTGKLVPVVVSKNTDGDTIHVRMPNGQDKTIRMLLIDTPEDVKPGTPIEPYSLQAAAYAKQVLPVGKHIYIQEGKPGYTLDKYGRLLAYVFITKSDMYNEDVVRKGLARVAYIYPPNTDYLSTLDADQSYAKSHHLYIWSIQGYVTSSGYSVPIAIQWDKAHNYGGYSASSSSSSPSSSSSSGITSSSSGSGTLSVVSSNLNVSPRSQASVTVKTKPGVTGTIEVDYKSGPSHASGLEAQTANSQGIITWTWTIGSSTAPGTWPVHITAAGKTITVYLHVS